MCRDDRDVAILDHRIVGDIAARREFAADAASRSSRPTRVLQWIPITFQQPARSQLPGQFKDRARVFRGFCQRRRIGKLQMQRHDLRMEKVAAIERSGNRDKTTDFCGDIDGQAIALAEIAIEVIHKARLPLLKIVATARAL